MHSTATQGTVLDYPNPNPNQIVQRSAFCKLRRQMLCTRMGSANFLCTRRCIRMLSIAYVHDIMFTFCRLLTHWTRTKRN